MNAVNLIPQDSRRSASPLTASPQTWGLIGGLVIVLLGAILYVSASNTVSSRSAQLARLDSGVQAWQVAANSYAPFMTAASQREAQLVQVRQLAAARFPWSDLLSQIGSLMPAAAELSSLQAATAPTATGGAATPTTTTPSSAATPATPATVPSVQLQGCAKDQATVAQTMTQLHEIPNVSAVTLASTSTAGTSGGSATTAGSSSSGCGSATGLPVQFEITLTFSSAPAAAAASGATTPAGSGTTASAQASTGSAAAPASSGSATPQASTGSTSSGASAQ